MELEVVVTHKTCDQIFEWRKQHAQVGVYPAYKKAEMNVSERIERSDFVTSFKMECEQCGDEIYVGVSHD